MIGYILLLTYTLETWEQYYPECLKLWKEHYEEFFPAHEGKMEMAPDLEVYKNLERLGSLQITVVRDSGKMVGYCLVAVRPHIHYCHTLCGFEDSYFLSKPYRRGFVGVKLIKQSVACLKKRGVKKVFFMTKEFRSIAKIFEFLGMKKIDTVYTMRLED